MYSFRFWLLALLVCLCFGSCNSPYPNSSDPEQSPEGLVKASHNMPSQSSNFPEPVAGKLNNQFKVSITWEKTYESSLRDVKPERLDGFQGPWLEELIPNHSRGSASNIVYIQFPQLAAKSLFDGTEYDWEDHIVKDLEVSWNIERAGYTYGPEEPLFQFTVSQFEKVRAVEEAYLIVGCSYYWNPKEGLPNVYCIRSPEDELPFGPHSFDVLNDSIIALADPLKNRLVLLNKQGKIRLVHKLAFSPSHLQYKRNQNRLEVFDPQEEHYYELNMENYLGPAQEIA
ncbi:MAG: hypothetical protein AAGA10_19435, partial [Bacteroidota bacterium]